MTTVSPTRRVKISIAKLLLGLCCRFLGRTPVRRGFESPAAARQSEDNERAGVSESAPPQTSAARPALYDRYTLPGRSPRSGPPVARRPDSPILMHLLRLSPFLRRFRQIFRLLRQSRDLRLDGLERLVQQFRAVTAGLREIRPASALAADLLRDRSNQVPGGNPVRQVLRDA